MSIWSSLGSRDPAGVVLPEIVGVIQGIEEAVGIGVQTTPAADAQVVVTRELLLTPAAKVQRLDICPDIDLAQIALDGLGELLAGHPVAVGGHIVGDHAHLEAVRIDGVSE
jgi:hypothetical protein